VDNLPSIAAQGLLCDGGVAAGGVAFHSIAFSDIKARRAGTVVPCDPGGTLADYVPFYFAPRSPMLYTISLGNVTSVADGQSKIVHLVLSAEDLVAEQECVFTDGHAIMDLSNFYNDLADLRQLDWTSISTRKWGSYYDATDETKRKKQAEFLAHGRVPWKHVRGIAVPSAACAILAQDALVGVAHLPPVAVKQDWYY
jgi:hypothetical protein